MSSLAPTTFASFVPLAIQDLAHTSIRFGIGRFTTKEEIDFAVDLCVKHVNRLREMSPLWELYQEGVDISSIQWTQEH